MKESWNIGRNISKKTKIERVNIMGENVAIRWVVALKSEAEAICKQFQMKLDATSKVYPIYRDQTGGHWLTISGIGRVNSAAATIYLHQVSSAPPWAGWMNVGIAGHGSYDYGSLHLVDKILEKNSNKMFYPRFITSSDISRSDLVTVDAPEIEYKTASLFDMEGSSFFDTACRLTCQQLIILLKIVSDGPKYKLTDLTKERTSELIQKNLEEILNFVNELWKISCIEESRLRIPAEFEIISRTWHFSQARKNRLKELVRKWAALYPNKEIAPYIGECKDADSVISTISDKLNGHEINWGEID